MQTETRCLNDTYRQHFYTFYLHVSYMYMFNYTSIGMKDIDLLVWYSNLNNYGIVTGENNLLIISMCKVLDSLSTSSLSHPFIKRQI